MFWSLTNNNKRNEYLTKYYLCENNIVEGKTSYETSVMTSEWTRKVSVHELVSNDPIDKRRAISKRWFIMKGSLHGILVNMPLNDILVNTLLLQ